MSTEKGWIDPDKKCIQKWADPLSTPYGSEDYAVAKQLCTTALRCATGPAPVLPLQFTFVEKQHCAVCWQLVLCQYCFCSSLCWKTALCCAKLSFSKETRCEFFLVSTIEQHMLQLRCAVQISLRDEDVCHPKLNSFVLLREGLGRAFLKTSNQGLSNKIKRNHPSHSHLFESWTHMTTHHDMFTKHAQTVDV